MKILAVDDEKIALDHIQSILQRVEPEAEIIACRNGETALAAAENGDIRIAFLDIELRDINGIALANRLKETNPHMNVIFTTGYGEYARDAFSLHASGYIRKPITEEKVRRELDDLRHPLIEPEEEPTGKLRVHAFGNFEVYDREGVPLFFQYAKSKELLAYLIDRNGTFCTNGEIMAVLWGDDANETKTSYLKNIRSDLTNALNEAGFDNVIIRRRGQIAIVPDAIDCDYFDWLNGKRDPKRAYRGEYMVQYSWGEFTNSQLEKSV